MWHPTQANLWIASVCDEVLVPRCCITTSPRGPEQSVGRTGMKWGRRDSWAAVISRLHVFVLNTERRASRLLSTGRHSHQVRDAAERVAHLKTYSCMKIAVELNYILTGSRLVLLTLWKGRPVCSPPPPPTGCRRFLFAWCKKINIE